jgi:hypothetical protein
VVIDVEGAGAERWGQEALETSLGSAVDIPEPLEIRADNSGVLLPPSVLMVRRHIVAELVVAEKMVTVLDLHISAAYLETEAAEEAEAED